MCVGKPRFTLIFGCIVNFSGHLNLPATPTLSAMVASKGAHRQREMCKLGPADPGASQAELCSADRARRLPGAVTPPVLRFEQRMETSGSGHHWNLLPNNCREESCPPNGPAPASYSCLHPAGGRQSVCLFIFNVKLTSLSCSRWFLFQLNSMG